VVSTLEVTPEKSAFLSVLIHTLPS